VDREPFEYLNILNQDVKSRFVAGVEHINKLNQNVKSRILRGSRAPIYSPNKPINSINLVNLFNQSTQSTYLTTQPILPINENLLFTDRYLEYWESSVLAHGSSKDPPPLQGLFSPLPFSFVLLIPQSEIHNPQSICPTPVEYRNICDQDMKSRFERGLNTVIYVIKT